MANTVLTQFSKAVKDTIALSFARSARDNCDRSCRLWSACYAMRIERIYRGLNAKLGRHARLSPTTLVNRAIVEIESKPLRYRWARLSVDGSLPSRGKMSARQWQAFCKALRQLILLGINRGARWHIPVESMAKARSYRKALEGTGVVVRRTSQAPTIEKLLESNDCRSWVVAEKLHNGCVTRDQTRRNTELAFEYARRTRESGESAVVCAAIWSDSHCGECTACSDARVKVVYYPFHS